MSSGQELVIFSFYQRQVGSELWQPGIRGLNSFIWTDQPAPVRFWWGEPHVGLPKPRKRLICWAQMFKREKSHKSWFGGASNTTAKSGISHRQLDFVLKCPFFTLHDVSHSFISCLGQHFSTKCFHKVFICLTKEGTGTKSDYCVVETVQKLQDASLIIRWKQIDNTYKKKTCLPHWQKTLMELLKDWCLTAFHIWRQSVSKSVCCHRRKTWLNTCDDAKHVWLDQNDETWNRLS